MRHAKVFNIISLITFVLAVVFLATKGLHFSIEFTGGTVMEVAYSEEAEPDKSARALNAIGLTDISVTKFGTERDVLIRLPLKRCGDEAERGDAEAGRRGDEGAQGAGSARGAEARRVRRRPGGQGARHRRGLALLMVCVGIMVYLAFRFEWRFSVATIIANLHDVVIILGFFAFFQWEFSLPVLAAILAILGYSVNESVVVFDRVRENFKKMRKASVDEVMDASITGHHLAHDHHPRLHADDGAVDPLLRRGDAALLRARAHHRHLLRHLLVGAGGRARSPSTSAPRARTS
jgi:preprotein translocase subunit SecF